MRINLNGSFDLGKSLAESFAFLTDIQKLSGCITDLNGTKIIDKHTFETSLTVKIGPINGNFNARCAIAPSPPDSINITIDGSGTGSTMHLVLALKLSSKAEKLTGVDWNASAEIGGLVSGLGETILKEMSNSKIREIIDALKKALA